MRRLPQFIITLVVVGIVIALAITGDSYVRHEMEVIGQGEIARGLSDEAGDVVPEQVDLTVGGSSALLQLALGSVDRVDVHVADMSVGPVRADFNAQLFDLPTNRVEPIGRVASYLEFDLTTIEALAIEFVNGAVEDVALEPPYVMVTTSLAIASTPEKVPATLAIDPVVRNGEIVLVPAFVQIGVDRYTPASLQQEEGVDPATMLNVTGFCIASSIPEALTVEDIRVANGALVIVLGADQLSVSELTGPHGVCPD